MENKEPKIMLLAPFRLEGKAREYSDAMQPDGEVVRSLNIGHRPSESVGDNGLALLEQMRVVAQAEKDGYDAVLVVCFLDPGVEECREITTTMPVFGVCQVAMGAFLSLAHKIGIITPTIHVKRGVEANLRKWHMDSRVSVRSADTVITESQSIWDSGDSEKQHEIISHFADVAQKLIEVDDCGLITLGCGGVAWLYPGLRKELAERHFTDVPVYHAHETAKAVVKTLVSNGCMHSKNSYPYFGDYKDLWDLSRG